MEISYQDQTVAALDLGASRVRACGRREHSQAEVRRNVMSN